MISSEKFELHTSWWQRFQAVNEKQRLPHALLLIGSQHEQLVDFAYKMSAAFLCLADQKPCDECKSCRLVRQREHPDLCHLAPDATGGIIKVDQIRDLHDLAFTSAQLAGRRVIMIHPAEKMNSAAANALLKLLEEPPASVSFLLIAEQISTLPATLISRCQQWRFSSTVRLETDYLTAGQEYTLDSERGRLFNELPTILVELGEVIANKLSICALAKKWSTYQLSDLLWLIYLINAQLIDYKLNGRRHEQSWTEQLWQLAQHFHPIHLFKQLDQINKISRKLQRNISINQILALENLLIGYLIAQSRL